ncbi:MAG: poly-gamma-glutamate hydrolase family protein [Alphaproteobacteria bacterium]
MPDWYQSFSQLEQSEQEGTHYRIVHVWRESEVAIVAPHGGSIEPGTSQIATAIAGESFNLYCFEGMLPRSEPHERLHITSHRFDEPRCVDLVARSDHVVTVHGLLEMTERTLIGGLDDTLKETIRDTLTSAGYAAEIIPNGRYSALSPANICNRGRRSRGVQLELGRDVRILLRSNQEELTRFGEVLRESLGGQATRRNT